jgi:hypothetical protein
MWSQLAGVALGIWLMASPAVLNYGGGARVCALVLGPLAASFSWIALSEVTRPIRRLNLPLGIGLLLSVLFFQQSMRSALNSAVVGLLLGVLALVSSPIKGSYGGGWWRNA